jgi:negative regulator of flagellin synthesis FlgM
MDSMKINGNGAGIELLSYLKQLQQQQKPADLHSERNSYQVSDIDKVNLSDRGREVQQAFNMLKGMPDVRDAKVARIRMDVENGTYQVVGPRIATEMLREAFENNMILQRVGRLNHVA